ncbi:MAG TPA: DnaJ domain-containing protein [Polyangiales bacterium]|nr:DnaJ domain-containing protein [Polyangiales bacterium]
MLYLQARRLSGTLAIWASDGKSGQDRILFEQGLLTAMRPVEPAKTLYAALMPLFAREDGPYGFYDGQNLLGQSGILREPIDIHTLLSRGVRVHVQEALVDSVLERVRGRQLKLRSDFPLERLELNQRELVLIEPLRGVGASVDTLVAAGALPVRDAKRTLYLLTLVKAVEASEGRGTVPIDGSIPVDVESFRPGSHSVLPRSDSVAPRSILPPISGATPLSGAPRPANENALPSSPPPGLPAADEARWHELIALHKRIDALTHYELLGVPTSASGQEAQTAYFALVKKYHPDRLPASFAPLARVAQAMFERMTEANETLNHAEQRADYDKQVQGGGGTREAERLMRNVLESAVEFQKAEVHLRRRDFAQALDFVRSALAKNPDEADYHALLAWILHLTHTGPDAPFDDILRALDKALKANARHERAHYYRGVILKRLKRDNEAVRHFRAAAELNPHNVDAAREVRLASMRRDSKPPAAGQNVLSRLFNKK